MRLAAPILDALSAPMLTIGALGCLVSGASMARGGDAGSALVLACSVHVVVSMLLWRTRDREVVS